MYKNVREYPNILKLAEKYAMADSRIRCDDLEDSIYKTVDRLNVVSECLKTENRRAGAKALDEINDLINTIWCSAILEGFTNGFLLGQKADT
ncbi:MAG: hypothetical protein LUD81_10395 [Clostridiales bacterium]|nr:hypothetical protein [Clostridiales bacterium]